jgi:hypothetical protein
MVFGNEMCQTLTKQPEKDGIKACLLNKEGHAYLEVTSYNKKNSALLRDESFH